MSDVERIHQKYVTAASRLDATWIDLNVFSFGLRLALYELADSVRPDQRNVEIIKEMAIGYAKRIDALQSWLNESGQAISGNDTIDSAIKTLTILDERNSLQAERLGKLLDWLAGNGFIDDGHEIVDTAIEMIESQRKELAWLAGDKAATEQSMKNYERQIASLRAQIAHLEAERQAQPHSNGAEPTVTAAAREMANLQAEIIARRVAADAADALPTWHDGMLATLTPEVRDYWHGIAAGRWTWRRLPKGVRLAMVRHVLSFGPPDGGMTQSYFDDVKPEWMPPGSAHPPSFGVTWAQLNDLRTEIEAY